MDSVSTAVASATSQAQLEQSASIMVLNKALDAQVQGAAALIQSLPQMQYNNPANLGQNIDTRA